MADGESEVQCPCCGLHYESSRPKAFPERRVPLDPRRGVCWDCVNHPGDGPEATFARGRHHGRMLRRAYEAAREQAAEARRERVEMQRELNMRPVQTVVRVENLDEIVVESAHCEREDAYRRRDVAMGALSDVRLLHHKQRDDKVRCSCGTRYEQCDMAQIADRWDGIELWEMSQAGRAYRGQRHYLQRDHPALKDPHYFGDVYGA